MKPSRRIPRVLVLLTCFIAPLAGCKSSYGGGYCTETDLVENDLPPPLSV
jgi:hypothetical protein